MLTVLGLFLIWAWRTRQRLLTQFIQARLLDQLSATVSKPRQKARLVLLFSGIAFIALALARPQWGMAWEETRQRGLDIVVAIDTSRSMLANDIAPNRLTRAKLAALDLMREAKSDRLGLVAFAGTAFLQCPLTLDDEAFRQSIEAIDTTIIPQGGSALSQAITTALTAFANEEDNYKVLVIFTDGEDHEAGAVEAAREAAGKGLRIFSVGVGTAEGELLRVTGPNNTSEFLKDDAGNAVKSRLNEGLLREIASAANGFYLPLRGADVVETLYERGLAPLPKSELATKFVRRFHERFQWPLAAGILFLTAEMLLSDRRRQTSQAMKNQPTRKVSGAVAAACFFGVCLSAVASPGSARKDFEAGRYRESLEEYRRLAEEKPGDVRLRYNAGASAYRAGAYDQATEHFSAALRAEDVKLQQQAYYNLGNTLYRAGEESQDLRGKQTAWEQAVQHYDASLKLLPEDSDAKHNLEVVRKKLEELKKQQEQQPQNQPNQDNQQKDDQQKQEDQPQQSKEDQNSEGKKQENSQKQDSQNQKNQQQKEQQPSPAKDEQEDKQGKPDDQKAKSGDQKEGPKKQDGQQGKDGMPEEESGGEPQAGSVLGQMSMQEALQLLDAQQGDVKALIFKPAESGKPRPLIFKDW